MACRVEIGYGVEWDKHHHRVLYNTKGWESFILAEAVNRFGGASIIRCQGVWRNAAGTITEEAGRILRIDGLEDATPTKDFAIWIRDLLNQESVVWSQSIIHTEFL